MVLDSTWVDHPSLSLDLTVGGSLMQAQRKNSIKEEAGALEAEIYRVSEENKRLNEKLAAITTSYAALQSQLHDLMPPASSDDGSVTPTRKRKRKSESLEMAGDDDATNCSTGNLMERTSSGNSSKRLREEPKPKISHAYVCTDPSDSSLVVKDGYQWRKYGQKVTRDNPCPRAYFRCSFAPACPVKKKVQRSAEDTSILVATYEGEHTHAPSSQAGGQGHHGNSLPCRLSSSNSTGRTVSPDMARPGLRQELSEARREKENKELQQRHLVEQMASTMTKDPGFTAALASAISGRILRLSPDQ